MRQEITGEHPKDITAVLQALVRDGFLSQQNQRRWASYRLAGDSPQSDDDSPQSVLDSLQCSPQSDDDSPQPVGNSLQFDPDDLVLAEPARRRAKLPSAEMRKLIEALCAKRWFTSRELGALLNRDPDNLQSRFLTALVRESRLRLRYPDVPNRPDQAYHTVSATE